MKERAVEMFNMGMNAMQVARELGVSDRAIRYYKRYANGAIPDGRCKEAFATQARFGKGTRGRHYAPGGSSLMSAARTVQAGASHQANQNISIAIT
jgi:hypothetical protein